MLGRIRNRYQTYCTIYKMHAITTNHRGTGCPIDRDIDLHMEDAEATGIDNNNESISGSDTTIPWEDWRQKVTLMNLYPETRPS